MTALVDVRRVVLGLRQRGPLAIAADHGSIELLRLLLANGADAALPDRLGRTALTAAEENGHAQIVALLRGLG